MRMHREGGRGGEERGPARKVGERAEREKEKEEEAHEEQEERRG